MKRAATPTPPARSAAAPTWCSCSRSSRCARATTPGRGARWRRRCATTADPARAYFQLGLVEQQAGRYNAAREAYLRSASADPTGYAARYNLATLAHGVGADEEARHHLDVLLRHHPNDVTALTLQRAIDRAPPTPAAALHPAP